MAKKHQIVLGIWGIRSSFRSLIALLVTILIITAVYLSQDSKWVFDNQSYPLYKEKECTYMSDQLACEKFGRKDLSYQNWRFNATALLERLRNKRLIFVGDSLNRGQWVSMVCLADSAVPPTLKSMHTNGSLSTFKATVIVNFTREANG
ncbi:protein trichome birefringence-like 34 [Quercus suber]|uniref:Protein trichome birefringence-like 34 n=1 Tax=Quercus suber TaxID=58331 RepID=A0AAW0K789_QUESU